MIRLPFSRSAAPSPAADPNGPVEAGPAARDAAGPAPRACHHRSADTEPNAVGQVVGAFTRVIRTEPAGGGKQHGGGAYGPQGMGVRFVLVGELGATQLLVMTGWAPGERTARAGYPFPLNLGFHWRLNPHEPGAPDTYLRYPECDWFDGGCYFQGSALDGWPALERLVAEGADAVWAELERHYHDVAGWAEP